MSSSSCHSATPRPQGPVSKSGTHLWRTHGPGLGPHGRSPGPQQSHLGTHGIGCQMTCQPGQLGSVAHPQTVETKRLAKVNFFASPPSGKRGSALQA